MRASHVLLGLATTTLLAAGCVAPRETGQHAVAVLEPRSGSQVSGSVRFRERRAGVLWAEVDLRGLAPGSVHGFHVHDKPDCSAPDAMSAGGHFNPAGSQHGRSDAPAHHAGDLPSLTADGAGRVHATIEIPGLTLGVGPLSIVGHSLVVHRDADDFTSQPAGNSGPRVACGVVTPG
jgi:Cu-Zn family superoxide dismutase